MENNIKPTFNSLEAKVILNHLEELTETNAVKHTEILNFLCKQIETIDFEALAFPQIKELRNKLKNVEIGSNEAKEIIKQIDRLKLTEKHYLILSIEHIIKKAETNDWGICKQNNSVYLYNGCYWSEVGTDAFQLFLGNAAESMGVYEFTAKHYQFREKLLKQFLATGYLETPNNSKNSILINLQNGTCTSSK